MLLLTNHLSVELFMTVISLLFLCVTHILLVSKLWPGDDVCWEMHPDHYYNTERLC